MSYSADQLAILKTLSSIEGFRDSLISVVSGDRKSVV